MNRALALAKRGLGSVEPNPMVGAVIVKDGREVAGGYHARFGGLHAEVRALEMLDRAKISPDGCEMYVTLEPCCHRGKTGPCTEAIIRSGIRTVHIPIEDPFAAVCGQGVRALRRSGIDVRVGVCRQQAAVLNEAFIKRVRTGLPWVIGKWAQSIDGRIATRDGDSKWLSGEKSRAWVHRLRGRVDAIVVGVGTAIKDDPMLTARGVRVRRLARRVVVDPHLRLPMGSRLVDSVGRDREGAPVSIAVSTGSARSHADRVAALRDRGIEIIELPWADDTEKQLSLRPLLSHLAEVHEATNVVVEGGSVLIGSLLGQGLMDQVLVFMTPRIMADASAVPVAVGEHVRAINDATTLRLMRLSRLGGDVLLDYRVCPEPSAT